MKNSLERFIEGARKVDGPFSSETVSKFRNLLEDLSKTPVTEPWLAELLSSSHVDKELYRDPENGFLLLAHTENEGQYRVPHDHGSGWVIYAVQSGGMEMATYYRYISQKGKLQLVRRESYRMHSGDCKVFLPGDIHDTRCLSKAVLMLRLTSCDLKKEDREGRMIKYQE